MPNPPGAASLPGPPRVKEKERKKERKKRKKERKKKERKMI